MKRVRRRETTIEAARKRLPSAAKARTRRHLCASNSHAEKSADNGTRLCIRLLRVIAESVVSSLDPPAEIERRVCPQISGEFTIAFVFPYGPRELAIL